MQITRKLLKDYRKIKQEIPLLEMELKEMRETDSGIGNSTIFDYRTGQARPQSVIGFEWERYERRTARLENKSSKQ